MPESPSIIKIVELLRDELLVMLEEGSDRVGNLYKPQTAREEPSVTGTILSVGPLTPPEFGVGRRVVVGFHSGTTVTPSGTREGHCKILVPMQVLCFLPPEGSDPLQEEGSADLAEPIPGQILVERLEQPLMHLRIILPAGWRETARSAEAIIKALAEPQPRRCYFRHALLPFEEVLAPMFSVGDHVFLSTMIGKRVDFGRDRTLWVVTPSQILCKLHAVAGVELKREEEPMQHWDPAEMPPFRQEKPSEDEGNPRGLR